MSILLVESCKILSNISSKIKLFLLTSLLLQGDSLLVNLRFMFIASHILVKWSFAKSPPLSLRNCLGKPHAFIRNWNILLMISDFLDVITADTEKRVTWYIMCVAICIFCKI